jgi:hypothetical protein
VGLVVVRIGVIEWAVGLGVFVKNQFSRWTGVVVLCANVIAQLLMIPADLVAPRLHVGSPRDLRTDRVRQADLQHGLSTQSRRRDHLGSSHQLGATKCSFV